MDILTRAKPASLDLTTISEKPGPYCMSFGYSLQPLIHSLKATGLINSPIVIKNRKGRVDVIAGYRRILALRQLQRKTVPCRDLSDAGLSPLQLLLINLHDNLATRRFNEVEKGMILNRLMPHVSREEILRGFMPLLGLASHEPTLEIFLRLEKLDQAIKQSLVHAHISFQTVRALMEMTSEPRGALFEWMKAVKFNANQQAQFIAYTTDISVREKKRVSQLLRENDLSKIFEKKELNDPQKIRLLLKALKSRRFPLLTRSEKVFQQRVQSLRLPEGVKVYHPPFFEGSEYRLEILFKDGRQLMKSIDALGNLSGLGTLGEDPWQEEEV